MRSWKYGISASSSAILVDTASGFRGTSGFSSTTLPPLCSLSPARHLVSGKGDTGIRNSTTNTAKNAGIGNGGGNEEKREKTYFRSSLKKIWERLLPLDKLSFFENYAMFMGKAQLVEMAMKGILIKKYGHNEKQVERWTFGRVIDELDKCGLRKDFLALLRKLNEYRIEIAHNLLADDALGKSLVGLEFQCFSMKTLKQGLFTVEETVHVYDFLSENKYL